MRSIDLSNLRIVSIDDFVLRRYNLTTMYFLTANTIIVCTATRGPIATLPCRIAPHDR